MIQLIDISVNFGAQTVFDHCSLSIPGRHFGLVGQNGSGKSTLLKMIAGMSEPNEGQVVVPKRMKIAYLPQEIAYNNATTLLLEEVLTVFNHVFNLEKEMRSLEARISEDHSAELLQAYDQLQERFHQLNGYAVEAKAKEILTGLGFKETDFERPVSEFSGGWHMRIALAKILLKEPDCLMLDEPTNHLDMETLVWLENLLFAYRGTLIIVSHDRYFIDKLINSVIEVDKGKITSYAGNFTDYEIQKEQRIEHELSVMKNQQRKIAHLEQFVDRFRYKASKAKQVQSRVKQLSKIKVTDIDTHTANIRFSFNKPERSGDPVVAAENLGFAYDIDPIFTDSNFEIRRGEKVALVGPNGVGKSTLMKLITGDLKAQEGKLSLGYNLQIGYFAQHHLEQLDGKNTVLDEIWNAAPYLPKSEVRSILGRFLFSGEDVEKPVAVLSGGEKSRMVLIKLLLSKANFLILDEPTNHLDMQSKEILASALDDFDGSVLIVSHDRFFLDMLVTKVVHFKDKHAKEFLGNYSEYEEKFLLTDDKSSKIEEKPPELDRKTQKRLEAEERQKRYQAQKGLREEIITLDKKIETLTSRKKELDEMFISPDFKDFSLDEMNKLSREHETVSNKLEEVELRWLELQERLGA
ncbi:MAG: ABC-F family ATP-binding cassette domain-containing protein [Candidatus Marinimicrobia bacterium]|nr:ABC-F family ATP-binding cassette domain-containing protein [Candidatus Neomarinimicrobiota bacterium]